MVARPVREERGLRVLTAEDAGRSPPRVVTGLRPFYSGLLISAGATEGRAGSSAADVYHAQQQLHAMQSFSLQSAAIPDQFVRNSNKTLYARQG
jgi:hypothetical protein